MECLSCEIRDFTITNADAGNATAIRNKVVAGREFNYRAINVSSRAINWELGEAPTWTINPVSPTTWDLNTNRRKSRGIGIVDNSIMPLSNSEFRATNGLVKIVDAPSGNDVCVDNVEVFFPKDEMNVNDPSVPNWFYYWTEEYGSVTSSGLPFFTVDPVTGNVTQGTTPNQVTFNLVFRDDGDYKWRVPAPGTSVNIIYGSTNAGLQWFDFAEMTTVPNAGNVCPPLNFRKVMTGYGNLDFTINIGEGCGYQVESHTFDLNTGALTGDVTYKGIEGFVAVIYHELEHWKLKEELWPNGYDSQDDCDKDGYPDSWEDSDPIAITYGFNSAVPDVYMSDYDATNLSAFGPATHYEEVKCRICESSKNTKILNPMDWSFDFTNDFQGKNWK